MSRDYATSTLKLSQGALNILVKKGLVSDPPTAQEIRSIVRNNAMVHQLELARRQDRLNQEQAAQAVEKQRYDRSELYRQLQRAKDAGDFTRATAIHELLDEAA